MCRTEAAVVVEKVCSLRLEEEHHEYYFEYVNIDLLKYSAVLSFHCIVILL